MIHIPFSEVEAPDIRILAVGNIVGVHVEIGDRLEEVDDVWCVARVVVASTIHDSIHGVAITTVVPSNPLGNGHRNPTAEERHNDEYGPKWEDDEDVE